MKTLLLVCAAIACCLASEASDDVKTKEQKIFYKDIRPGKTSSAVSGTQSPSLRIWNGEEADEGQFPYYVGVYIDLSSFCGGSLINPKWVLTAGHCVDGGSFWVLFMGVTSMNVPKQDGREVHVTRGGIRHPDYDSERIINDIAIIQLVNQVTLSERVNLVTLTPPGVSYIGKNATVAGFGVTGDTAQTISSVLHFTTMPIVSNDVCFNAYKDTDPSQICLETDEVQTSSCSGDSGGPLVIYDENMKPTQVGATSFGASRGCAKGYPVGFVNIAMFIDWISENTGINFDSTKA